MNISYYDAGRLYSDQIGLISWLESLLLNKLETFLIKWSIEVSYIF